MRTLVCLDESPADERTNSVHVRRYFGKVRINRESINVFHNFVKIKAPVSWTANHESLSHQSSFFELDSPCSWPFLVRICLRLTWMTVSNLWTEQTEFRFISTKWKDVHLSVFQKSWARLLTYIRHRSLHDIQREEVYTVHRLFILIHFWLCMSQFLHQQIQEKLDVFETNLYWFYDVPFVWTVITRHT